MPLEAVGLAFSVAQTLLAALQSPEIRGLFSMWGYKSKLEDLESTVRTIKSVLLSADSKQVLTPQEQDFIDSLKDVVYEADDLIDEFLTTVALQQQHQNPGKVQNFISSMKELGFGYNMSRKVKNIRKMLDRVADDANKYSFKIDDLPIRKRRDETCSYVNVSDIVGRDDDQRMIVDMLLDPDSSQMDVSIVTIVGIGGLGKTALAQLIYNDGRVKEHFPLRLWVCVSDQDQNQFEVKRILANILKSMGESHINDFSLEQLVKKLRGKLDQKKYLLVLDDVWTESNGHWFNLKQYLLGLHQRGNKIVISTRSVGTAIAVGSSHTHKLQGLSDEYSWRLFEMVVGNEQANSSDLVEIGKHIVKKCANVPLAIKVAASLLFGRDENTWRSFQKSRLCEFRKDENSIMPILEFSYRHLSPSLKSCFTYCALFPKDFEFNKVKLLGLWMAQGYVEPLDEGQNMEDAAEEYFQILARRCFFQDLENNQFQEAISFKIHDLMHDMAQQVAGKEIFIANSTTSTVGKRIRHLYDDHGDSLHSRTHGFMVEAKIRTYLTKYGHNNSQFPVSTLLAKWRSLRTLDMRYIGLSSLPDTIGQLLHLRYLDLSYNGELEMLPKSLTKLINLQFLNLHLCGKLKELPRDLSKLVNLRTLYVPEMLEHMPVGLARMTRLTRLNRFIVNQRKSCLNLEDLRALSNLKGSLDIIVRGNYQPGKEYCGGGEYICKTAAEHLNSISILCSDDQHDEQVLEDMQPHSNLKELTISYYSGVRMGGWAREDTLTTSLPNLVKIDLYKCDGLEELPWLGRLQHLKTLKLNCLENVEYMENRRSIGVGSSRDDGAVASNSSRTLESSIVLFFPSLEQLHLRGMTKLKGWWMGEDEIVNPHAHLLPSFPRLSKLTINWCPNLTSFPLCPCVETLVLIGLNERFEGIIKRGEMGVASSSSSSSYDSGKIREIDSDNLLYLNSLPMGAFQCLVKMAINYDDEVERLSKVEELLRGCSSSLRFLRLSHCRKLRSVSEGGGLEYLTALQDLQLWNLPELEFDETEEMPWRSLAQSLRSLTLCDIEKVDNLPKGMCYLTSLTSLYIHDLELKEIPEWIECLSSLQSLRIFSCKSLETLPRALRNLTHLKEFRLIECSEELKRRCEKPDGEYWAPILQHIPTFISSKAQKWDHQQVWS